MLYKEEKNIVLTDYIMSPTVELNTRALNDREWEACKSLKYFHQHYLVRSGIPVELSDIIYGIMDKAFCQCHQKP